VKIIGEFLVAAGKMGVGNLGQAKFGHALFLPGGLYFIRRRNDEIQHVKQSQSSSPAKAGDPVFQRRQ
jgi:hypothetical protein